MYWKGFMMAEDLDFSAGARRYVDTKFGRTALVDVGDGFPAVFLHGVGQSAYFWRGQLREFKSARRCIAIDLMAHGYTEALPDADVSFREQANMILAVLDQIGVDRFDLVMNDSGGAIGQIMAVTAPDRVRSMAFSNCDVHDNWPPTTLNEIREAAKTGVFADQMGAFLEAPEQFAETTGKLVYEDPAFATPELLRANIAPLVSSQTRKDAFNRYVGFQDHSQLVVIEEDLRKLQTPALIVWGAKDPFFPVEWAHWLHDALPNAEPVIELESAMLFFPEERPGDFNTPLKAFWDGLS